MADSNHKVAIIVALITVTGTLGAALLASWDKVFRPAPQVAAGTAASPTQAPAAAPALTTETPPPAAKTGTLPGTLPSLTGTWRDSTGPNNISRVRQLGNRFEYSRRGILPDGTRFEASGNGTLQGQQVNSSYQARYGNGAMSSGTCTGSVSADATRMDLQCVDSLLGPFASLATRE